MCLSLKIQSHLVGRYIFSNIIGVPIELKFYKGRFFFLFEQFEQKNLLELLMNKTQELSNKKKQKTS